MSNQQTQQKPPTTPVINTGIIDGTHRGSQGLWVRRRSCFGQLTLFAPFILNPQLKPDLIDGKPVKFELGEYRNRPVAVNAVVVDRHTITPSK